MHSIADNTRNMADFHKLKHNNVKEKLVTLPHDGDAQRLENGANIANV